MLIETAKNFDMEITPEQNSFFEVFTELLLDWNSRINLTAITDREDINIKHYIDSLTVLKSHNPPMGAAYIDVGTGAGFPAVPIKIMRRDIKLTLLDSTNKKVLFLKDVINKLDFNDTECIHARAEDYGRTAMREKYDIATSRAVASMSVISEYCLPLLKVGGIFIAMKGMDCQDELLGAKEIIKNLGGKIIAIDQIAEIKHKNIVIKKVKHTPGIYPRKNCRTK